MNEELLTTLDDAVAEVLGLLTGLDLTYEPELDRYQAITRQLNRALRSNALEKEWSWYASTENLGPVGEGQSIVTLPSRIRPRMTNDDAARLCDSLGRPHRFAYFLPRDALHKYRGRQGLWCSITNSELEFNRPLGNEEGELDLVLPVMREPTMFRLPAENAEVPDEIRQQEIDFAYPDIVVLRAAFYYAQTDPVMQPRVQTLEAQYKDLMYQIIERDDRSTDSPYQNEFFVPVQNGIGGPGPTFHWHPHSDERR